MQRDIDETRSMYEDAVRRDPGNFHSVPDEYRSYEFAKECVTVSPRLLSSLSSQFKTYDICKIAVTLKPGLLFEIPVSLRNTKMCLIAIRHDYRSLNKFWFQIPNCFRKPILRMLITDKLLPIIRVNAHFLSFDLMISLGEALQDAMLSTVDTRPTGHRLDFMPGEVMFVDDESSFEPINMRKLTRFDISVLICHIRGFLSMHLMPRNTHTWCSIL